ncbi:hypothetical protein RND71_005793 [Anisodus tanguticus]|uniref:AIG1-type G domain-containing protein n=1 Tax=Anisodus tanguticus TaxID=243964 RepID=A0AAE1VSP4_9SOLA|nr:hypothetical protein RND71_005793 [Anisodus tanguticus]
MLTTEPFNGSNKNEEQMDGPIDDAAPIAQIGRSCVKGVIGAVQISQDIEEQKDVLSCDATDLKGEESPAVALVNSNGKVHEYAEEQKDVLSSDVLTGKDSPAMGPLDLSDMPDEQKDSRVVGLGNLINKVQLYMEEQKDVLSSDQILNEAGSARDLSSSSGSSITRTPPPARPAGLGRAAPLLEPAPRVVQQARVNGTASPVQNQHVDESTNGESEEYDETRFKFLRLAHRLGKTPHNVVVAQQLEAAGHDALDFSCTIMVIGETCIRKRNYGLVIDTPRLLPCWEDQWRNEKILHSVKRFIRKTPPDIVLYLDRLDMQSRDYGVMPLLRNIAQVFGPSIWFNAIVILTHAASAPPEGSNESTNRAGQRVLPNGQVWKPHLLLLSFASKILAEANTLMKSQALLRKPYSLSLSYLIDRFSISLSDPLRLGLGPSPTSQVAFVFR